MTLETVIDEWGGGIHEKIRRCRRGECWLLDFEALVDEGCFRGLIVYCDVRCLFRESYSLLRDAQNLVVSRPPLTDF